MLVLDDVEVVGVLLLFFFRRFFLAATEAEMDTERRPVCDAIVCRNMVVVVEMFGMEAQD